MLEHSENDIQHFKKWIKFARYDNSYTVFSADQFKVFWIYGLRWVTLCPAEWVQNSLQPVGSLVWHQASQWTDTCIYIAPLSLVLFFSNHQWQSSVAISSHSSVAISCWAVAYRRFYSQHEHLASTVSAVLEQTQPNMQALGSDYRACIAKELYFLNCWKYWKNAWLTRDISNAHAPYCCF